MAAETARWTFTLAGLRAASSQTPGLLRLPASLQSAIAAFIGDIPTREVKQSVARLTSNMKARKEAAMISPRGGALAVEGSDDARAAVDEYLRTSTATQVRLSREVFAPAQAPVRYEYDEKNVAAYVAARMPAVYGAVHRVLSEVATRLPGFSPVRVLDYGSGPGTVLWAMREVWPESVEHVNLVEPSRAMATACRTLLQEVENLPLIKVHPSLSLFSRGLRKETRLHDLVVSSYALGELSTLAERVTAVRQLWALTRDVLVLIEPGTPQGSSIVREMRAHILHMEKKKLRRSAEGGEGDVESEARGAFVVAPCPHDGQCPMDKKSNLCHFIQRLERTTSQRVTKRQSKPTPLRAYEDEKFSFVVLRRGSRPSVPYPLEGLTIEAPEEEDFEFIEDPMSLLDKTREESEDGSHESEEFEGEEYEEEEYEEEEDDGVMGNRVADVGSGWARIVRTPIRRGRRTLLDLCAATEKDGSRGVVTRVVCSRRGHASPLHPQARKSRWGDLWPC
jgi:ribosomal protein RSM22 (predicted rRNA methylase)